MLFGLLPLIILGGIVALIVRAVAGRDDDREAGSTAVRRFFQYSLLLAVVVVVALGASGLLAELIPGENLIRRSPEQNARAFAFLIIGGPALYGLVRWIRRDLDEERRSFAWAFYLIAAALAGLITAATGLFEVGEAIVGVDDFQPNALSRFLVWGAVWFVHYRIAESEENPRLRWHRVGGSVTGLAVVAISIGGMVGILLGSLYDSLFGASLVTDLGSDLGRAIVGAVIGSLIWWRYWWSTYLSSARDTVWHGYVLLAGVLSGLLTMLGGATALLFTLLDWFAQSSPQAVDHFEPVPGALTAIGIGAVLWAYHRAVLHAERTEVRTEVDRVYDYLVAAVGLLAAGGGVTTILVAVVQAALPGDVSSGDAGEASVLMAAISLLVVGLPVWWRSWSKIQRIRIADPSAELASGTRRIYLFALFGVGGVVALVSLLTLGVQALEDLFSGAFGNETIFDIRIPLALVVTVGAIAGYHWTVRQEDQRDAPAEEDELVVRSVILVSADGADLASTVEQRTGVKVRIWHRPDSDAIASVDDVVNAIEHGTHPRLLVIARPDRVESIPYAESR